MKSPNELIAEHEEKAIKSLARGKYMMFGYHAATAVNLRKLLEHPGPSGFYELVRLARKIVAERT